MSVRVLLVDDQPLLLQGFAMILSVEDDLEVVGEAATGREAIELATRHRPDVVVMDVQMPVMDGMEATRVIREELKLSVPVVAMTAYAMAGDRERFLRSGMDDYVSKPVDMERLRQVIAANASRAPSS